MDSILSQPNAADEDYRVKDLLNFSGYVNDLKIVVDNTSRRSLIGIVGNYGVGKSVMLNTFKVNYASDSKETVWIHFDAWKYPDRSNLWEGFILDFVRQYDAKLFASVLKIIDGREVGVGKRATSGILKMIPAVGSGLSEMFTNFTATSPAKRVFEIQDLLEELLQTEKRRIYVVVEDADRSGSTGIYFIETLNQFLKNFMVDIEIKVFIPIARASFNKPKQRDAYIKTLDSIEYFQLTDRDMHSFVQAIFSTELLAMDHYEHYLVEWTQRLIHQWQFTIRDIKSVIRNAEITFKKLQSKGESPDPVIVYMIASARLMPSSRGGANYYDDIKINDMTIAGGEQMHLLLMALMQSMSINVMADNINDDQGSFFRRSVIFDDAKGAFGFVYRVNATTHTALPQAHGDKFLLPTFYLDS